VGRQQLFALTGAEGTAVSQEVDGLEQARLTGAVLADNAGRARIEFEVSRPDAPEVLDIDRGQHIGGRTGSEPHRHHDVLRLRRRGSADEAAAVCIGESELDLTDIDGSERIEEVVDVEANLNLVA
jgi:hypothetical protein